MAILTTMYGKCGKIIKFGASVQTHTWKVVFYRITNIFHNFKVIVSFSQNTFPWQSKNMHTFHKLLIHFWEYPVMGYISCKIKRFGLHWTVRKEHLNTRKFCPKNSQSCSVMVTKQIFEIYYLYFILCLFGYSVFWWYSMHCLRNICDLDIFVYTSCYLGNQKYTTSDHIT